MRRGATIGVNKSFKYPSKDPCKMSDVEELLDEVEGAYGESSAARKLKKVPPQECDCNKKDPFEDPSWKEAQDLLKEFQFEDTNPFGRNRDSSWKVNPRRSSDSTDQEVKCYPIYLGGSYELKGKSKLGFEKPCSNLKCIRCDFKVISFDNFKWDPSTDYLFLRENMPDFERVVVKLIRERGSRSYACQCTHLSIKVLTDIKSLPNLRWVCGKH